MPDPLRQFSQNWLANDELAIALVGHMDVRAGDRFLEIGAGEGRLTSALLRRGAAVAAVEFDERCLATLAARADAAPDRLRVIHQDILDFDPATLGGAAMRFVGNLPYAITSPILRWTCRHHQRVIDAHYMVPADVAERMLAPAGSAARGLLSVLVGWFFAGEIVRALGPGAFRPPPKIDSAFVALRPQAPPPCAAPGHHRRAVARGAFAHRRKTLANSLALSGWDKPTIAAALERLRIDATMRAQDLEVEDFARLAEALPEPAS